MAICLRLRTWVPPRALTESDCNHHHPLCRLFASSLRNPSDLMDFRIDRRLLAFYAAGKTSHMPSGNPNHVLGPLEGNRQMGGVG